MVRRNSCPKISDLKDRHDHTVFGFIGRDVWSQNSVERVEGELFGPGCPGFADEPLRRETAQALQPPTELAGSSLARACSATGERRASPYLLSLKTRHQWRADRLAFVGPCGPSAGDRATHRD